MDASRLVAGLLPHAAQLLNQINMPEPSVMSSKTSSSAPSARYKLRAETSLPPTCRPPLLLLVAVLLGWGGAQLV